MSAAYRLGAGRSTPPWDQEIRQHLCHTLKLLGRDEPQQGQGDWDRAQSTQNDRDQHAERAVRRNGLPHHVSRPHHRGNLLPRTELVEHVTDILEDGRWPGGHRGGRFWGRRRIE